MDYLWLPPLWNVFLTQPVNILIPRWKKMVLVLKQLPKARSVLQLAMKSQQSSLLGFTLMSQWESWGTAKRILGPLSHIFLFCLEQFYFCATVRYGAFQRVSYSHRYSAFQCLFFQLNFDWIQSWQVVILFSQNTFFTSEVIAHTPFPFTILPYITFSSPIYAWLLMCPFG